MMRMRDFGKQIIWLLLLLLISSCEEPYMPAVINSTERFLVVTGYINSGDGPTTIKLSRTQNLNEDNAPVVETGAKVWVELEEGGGFTLQETSPGTYTYQGSGLSALSTCRLRIQAAGKEYASDFITIKKTPPIDSVSWKADGEGLDVLVNAHDPQNLTRYYRWEYEDAWEYLSPYYAELEYVNGEVIPRGIDSEEIYRCYQFGKSYDIKLGSTVKLSDDRVSEALIQRIPASSIKLRARYSILVRQYALTKEEFEYWDILKRDAESLGTLFDPLPSQLKGNIVCLSNPSEKVIGFIGAYSMEEKRIFISRAELPTGWRRPPPPCALDTVELGDVFEYLESGGYLPVQEHMEGGVLLGYMISPRGCVDCTTHGTNVKPSYW